MTDSEIKLPRSTPEDHRAHWRVEDIAYDAIDRDLVVGDESLFYMLASASFIESGSGTYTRNLVAHYADYPDVAQWLSSHWEPEELQHGRALARYVQTVWPQFPWQAAYDSFFAEYLRLGKVRKLYAGALEMAARCVVEMGTTTFYHALGTLAKRADEPVLADLINHIRVDEVRHYKYFFAYFKTLKAQQPVSRWQVMQVLRTRLRALRKSDSDVALCHAWSHAHTESVNLFPDGAPSFNELSRRVFGLLSQRVPIEQAVRMTLKPLMLPHRLENWLQTPLAWLGRRTVMG